MTTLIRKGSIAMYAPKTPGAKVRKKQMCELSCDTPETDGSLYMNMPQESPIPILVSKDDLTWLRKNTYELKD